MQERNWAQEAPLTVEDAVSQLPATQLLMRLGYRYLTAGEALRLRGGSRRNVVLTEVLAGWLREHNVIRFRGEEVSFSEANVAAAVEALTDVAYDGLLRTNQKVYDLLCLGKSLPQVVGGDSRSFSLRYVDWEHPENNLYHVTDEFEVERRGSSEAYRPDLVLFVNGIPFAVIECKPPELNGKDSLPQAIEQQIRNQREDGIPQLFQYVQLVLALNKNGAKYATAGTAAKFWSTWREERLEEAALATLINSPGRPEDEAKLLAGRPSDIQRFLTALAAGGLREVTGQDQALYCLCRPERLLELAYRYTLFDAGVKKIARYQQYFCVRRALERLLTVRDERGARQGGVVWHTQGSGKSLTMVMLAKGLALEPSLLGHKIILVTDRVNLDDQLRDTFKACGHVVDQAKSGRHLATLLAGPAAVVVSTVIDKFETALRSLDHPVQSDNIFVLVDEGHRSQYGLLHARMRQALPRAAYLGFTGTPVMQRDKDTIARFGGLIHVYNVEQAVRDQAVVPLLYEGRHVEQTVYQQDLDQWFGVVTEGLTKEQVADLKTKFATSDQLNKAEQRVKRIAYDISVHFQKNWQHTGFKGQLVAPDKATALLYHRYLEEFGLVSSAVLISGPDEREGDTDVFAETRDEIRRFWAAMMAKYGNEKTYNEQLIEAFRQSDEPEIIIVVDKLLTGFDAPHNAVLYLCRKLKEHALLQAIARVNRVCEGKEYGYILDYRGVLNELDEALGLYAALPEFDREDLASYATTLVNISAEVAKLPQRHADLWDLFKGLPNRYDEEAYERLLGDEALRAVFYERLTAYAKTLAIALSSEEFLRQTGGRQLNSYQRDLRFFTHLRAAVRLRYAESVDYRTYEPRIRKLIDEYVGAGEVEQVAPPVSIFDEEAFATEVERVTGEAARADTIAHRALRTCLDRLGEDPAFYKRFSEMLEEAIRAFRDERLQAAEYLRTVESVVKQIVHRTDDDLPPSLRGREAARAYYGCVREVLAPLCAGRCDPGQASAEAALAIEGQITRLRVVNWTLNPDVQNQMRIELEDALVAVQKRYGLNLDFDQIDQITEKCLGVAKVRVP